MDDSVAHPGERSKTTVRSEFVERLARMGPAERVRESSDLVARLKLWATIATESVLLGTLPMAAEPDLTVFYRWWLASGRRLALARTGPRRSLRFHEIADLDGPWDEKAWGLREPPASLPLWEPGLTTLCLVPGLAFCWAPDGAGRLGRGGGYYDRWLATHPEVKTLGVGFSVQIAETLPLEDHDRKLDGLLLAGSSLRWVDLRRN